MRTAAVLPAVLLIVVGCSGAPAPTGTTFPTLAPTPSPTAADTATPSATTISSPTSQPTGNVLDAWRASATAYFGRIGETFEFDCPPGGEAWVVWGTDTYTADSSVCTAAVHAGLITFAEGGTVTIEMLEGQDSYAGTIRNEVETRPYGSYSGSFRFVGADGAGGSPTASPSPSPSGALVQLFRDDFSDPTSGFGTGDFEAGTVAYSDGNLLLTTSQAGAYLWSRRGFEAGSFPLVQVGAELTPDGDGMGGLFCGGANDHLVGIVLATDGRWFAVEILPGEPQVSVLDQGTLAEDRMLPPGASGLFGIECALLDGELELSGFVGLPPTPIALFRGDAGPDSFDRVAVYAEALGDDYSITIDDLVVLAGQSGGGLAAQLMTHIPESYRPQCSQTPPSAAEPGALVAVACFLQQSGGPGAEIVEYVLFDSSDSMSAAYQQRFDTWGGDSTGTTCREGPAESSYSIGEQQVGRVFCAAQTAGIRIDWSDVRLNILASATDFDASYAELYETWQDAGPNP